MNDSEYVGTNCTELDSIFRSPGFDMNPGNESERNGKYKLGNVIAYVSSRMDVPVEDQIRRISSFCVSNGNKFQLMIENDNGSFEVLEEAVGAAVLGKSAGILICDESAVGGKEVFDAVSVALRRMKFNLYVVDQNLQARCDRAYTRSQTSDMRKQFTDAMKSNMGFGYFGSSVVLYASEPVDGLFDVDTDDQIELMRCFCDERNVEVIDMFCEDSTSDVPYKSRRMLMRAFGSAMLNRADAIMVLSPTFIARSEEEYGSLRVNSDWLQLPVRALITPGIADIFHSPYCEFTVKYESSCRRLGDAAKGLHSDDDAAKPENRGD